MKSIRTVFIFIVGGLLIHLTYKFKYQVFVVHEVIWALLTIVGLILLIWTVIKDALNFKEERRIENFSLTAVCIIFTIAILTIEYLVQKNFNKPTLIKVYYDGDINGTGIDFKTDGTYIFENSAIGFSDYIYGNYKIQGDLITLDKKELDKVIETDRLKIIDKGPSAKTKKEKYLFQIDNNGQVINQTTEFRIVMDNR